MFGVDNEAAVIESFIIMTLEFNIPLLLIFAI